MSTVALTGVTIAVEGYISNKAGQPVNGASVSIVALSNKAAITTPFKLGASNNYNAYTDQSPLNVGVKFTAPGYATKIVSFNDLMIEPNVILQPGISPWMILAVIAAVAIYRKQSGKIGALNSGDVMVIFLLVGGVIGFSFIKQILESLGIWDSQDTKDLDSESSNPNSFWNPNYWRTVLPAGASYSYAITQATAADWCKEIYNSFGAFNDDEENAIAVFKRCRTRANASFLAWEFDILYNQDLLTFLRGGVWPQDRLSDSDVNTINKYITSLPKY